MHFRRDLFDGELPDVKVTLQRKRGMHGFFWPEKFQNRRGRGNRDELALNSDLFRGRSDKEILSTLVHEMVHVWQYRNGTPGRRGYHNREWARKMKEVGLQPSTTGKRGGMETGEAVTHYIIPDGPFDRACRKLFSAGFRLG